MIDINLCDYSRNFYINHMQSVIEHLSLKYKGTYAGTDTTRKIASEIRESIRFLHPYIGDHVQVENDSIYLDAEFTRDPKGVILFLPLVFDLKYDHEYDVIANGVSLGQIIFIYQQDARSILTRIVVIPNKKVEHARKQLYHMIQIKQVIFET